MIMVRFRVRKDCSYTVRDLQNREDLIFTNVDYDVEEIKEYFGNRPAVRNCDSFFVKVENGEYTEVYCMQGIVPHLDKTVCKIEFQEID